MWVTVRSARALGPAESRREAFPGCRFGAADPLEIPIDPNGNLTSKTEGTDTWAYEWNAENQLTKVEKNGVEQARFAYDPLGRRVEKVAVGLTTSYLYDEDDLLREQTTTGTSVRFVFSGIIDEPLASENSGVFSYFHLDDLSSVTKMTNASGAVTATYGYDAFGSRQEVALSGFGYTAREHDQETGLLYYRARYYDPKAGRFLSEDPAGRGATGNLYLYVDDSPTNFTDPLGLVKTSGCTAAQAQAIDDAVNDALEKLKKCRCAGTSGSGGSSSGGGGGDNFSNYMKIVSKAKYICKPNMKLCGEAPMRPFGNRIYIGGPGFDPNRCGPLPCTIIHEARHRTQWGFPSKKKENQAEEFEKRCCGL